MKREDVYIGAECYLKYKYNAYLFIDSSRRYPLGTKCYIRHLHPTIKHCAYVTWEGQPKHRDDLIQNRVFIDRLELA